MNTRTFNLKELQRQAKREVDRWNKSDKTYRRSFNFAELLITDNDALLRIHYVNYDPNEWEMKYGSKSYKRLGSDAVDLSL